MDVIQASATLAALAFAWMVIRAERHASRARDVAGARATLIAARSAIVEGWGPTYFGNEWDEARVTAAGENAAEAIRRSSWEQVFSVPTKPIELLLESTAVGELISERLAKKAADALWQIGKLNQFVGQQTLMISVGLILVEGMRPLTTRDTIARLVGEQARMLHAWTVAHSREWFAALCESLDEDLDALTHGEKRAHFFYPRNESWTVLGDAIALCFLSGALAVAIVALCS